MTRPVPVPDDVSAPHWAAAADHVLTIAKCSACGSYAHPPGIVCGYCGSTEPGFTFSPVTGRGRVLTWTVARQPFLPGFATPYVLVDVELEEQKDLRIVARLLDVDAREGFDADLHVGARVEVAFEELADGIVVPAFRLVSP
ncbi:MAG TPA: OB-fold domain-containing protein [Mycobacteriales bacterium]|nr:OB-fold domain-containing protein [Mycobacteriales bacterium]